MDKTLRELNREFQFFKDTRDQLRMMLMQQSRPVSGPIPFSKMTAEDLAPTPPPALQKRRTLVSPPPNPETMPPSPCFYPEVIITVSDSDSDVTIAMDEGDADPFFGCQEVVIDLTD